ncbi:MAG: hypothetical protein K0Q87_1512 [Neobacillus sp.]|nr:hypothetical protein [Neobacillus sp.]
MYIGKTINKVDDLMKKKVIVSILIFTFLFSGAWFLNSQTKRDHIKFVFQDPEPIGEYIFTPMKVEADTWNFKPREYIKIRKRQELEGP